MGSQSSRQFFITSHQHQELPQAVVVFKDSLGNVHGISGENY